MFRVGISPGSENKITVSCNSWVFNSFAVGHLRVFRGSSRGCCFVMLNADIIISFETIAEVWFERAYSPGSSGG